MTCARLLAFVSLLLLTVAAAPPAPPAAPKIDTLPAHRGGQDLVGARWPTLTFDRWIRGAPDVDDDAPDVKATLYRWWTDACPYCERSLPALDRLRKTYEKDGLRVVGVYHPKPPRDVTDAMITGAATERSFNGALALDQDWSELRSLYLDGTRRRATSASFLVDADGVIRFVHPGPELFPSEEARNERQNVDYTLLERAVRTLVTSR